MSLHLHYIENADGCYVCLSDQFDTIECIGPFAEYCLAEEWADANEDGDVLVAMEDYNRFSSAMDAMDRDLLTVAAIALGEVG